MTAYLTRRLITAVPLLWVILTAVFLLVECLPGDPFAIEPGPGTSLRAAETVRHAFGGDRPLLWRYGSWLRGALTGDLGFSHSMRGPVAQLIWDAAGNTFRLAGSAILLQFLLGVAAGVIAAGLKGGWIDRAITSGAGLLYAFPSYWLGLVLTWFLSVQLGWLPASQMRSLDAADLTGVTRLADALRHLILPCISLSLPAAAGIALYTRERLGQALEQEFIRAARARGLGEIRLILTHGLSNSLLPVIGLLGLALPGLVGGSVVVEVLFAWPGMGRLAYQAVLARDQPLILGFTWAVSLLVMGGSLLADLTSAALDPRVREAVP